MAALIALQLRLGWRGLPQVMRVCWVFGLVMLLSFFSKATSGRDSIYTLLAIPLLLIPMGTLLVVGGADPMIWQVPIRRSARVWARLVFLLLSGALSAFFILGLIFLKAFQPPKPWPLLLAHLELSWLAGGLLLFLAGDLIRRAHVIVQLIVSLLAVAPTITLVMFHLLRGLPWPTFVAEAAAVLVLLWLNLRANRNLEYHFAATTVATASPQEAVVEPGESCRIAVRVPGLASALLRSQLVSVLTWIFIVLWIAISLAPVTFAAGFIEAILLPFFVMRILHLWRPFQATPAPRGKAMAILFLPLFGMWVLTLGLQCWSVVWSETSLFAGSLTSFRLPLLTREEPSAELGGHLSKLPPEKVAQLVHDAYRTGYGLDVPVSQILSLRDPANFLENWMLDVDRRWESEVRWRILQWRLLIGVLALAWAALSFVSLLPGRWPRWLSGYLFLYGYLMMVLPTFFKGSRSFVSFIPARILPLYQTAFDQPWIPIAAFMGFAVLFMTRNYLVFKSSELAPDLNKAAT